MHTPGPWTRSAGAQTDILAGDDTLIAIARSGLNGLPREQAVANARLIAAAPSLLAALQSLVRAIDRAPSNPFDGLADNARAAIAQATQS